MSINKYLPLQFYHSGLEVTAVGRFGHIATKALPEANISPTNGTPYTNTPIERLRMKTIRSVLLARVWETDVLVSVDAAGNPRNHDVGETVPRDLVSYHYDRKTGLNTFRAVEDFLENPSIMTRRTVSMLALIGTANADQLIIDVGPLSDLIGMVRGDWSVDHELQEMVA